MKRGKILHVEKLVLFMLLFFVGLPSAMAREVQYGGGEVTVYVTPGEPTQITFPSAIAGGFKRDQSSLALERQNDYLVIFAQPDLPVDGEALLIHLKDTRTYAVRVKPTNEDVDRDQLIRIIDNRDDAIAPGEGSDTPNMTQSPRNWAPPSTVPGFMRELVLVAEFGKRGGIPGYRRSNRYQGETVLHDGAMVAKIDEIFMGSNYWGYVLKVENMLGSSQQINPATFRLDGTRAVAAERWQLAPRPQTQEQEIANAHTGKVYVITRALGK